MPDPARSSVDAALDDALRQPPEERIPFVRARLAHDPELLAHVEQVLREEDLDDGLFTAGAALNSPLFTDLCRTLAEPDPVLDPGGSLGPYHIAGPIGRGGMGEVYRARDSRLGRHVALKVLPRDLQQSADRLARFRREAQVLASLNHPRIANIYDVVEEGNVTALVLEFVDGPTLAERLASRPLSLPETIAIARDLAEAIEAAHGRGIVHRDLKPQNVKLTADGRAKVLDFGLAKALAASEPLGPGPGDADPFQTHPHIVMGTAAYMAPEQARGERVDHRADIWAFGCLLYEMLTGARPFEGKTPTEVVARILERDPDFGRLPAGTPPPLRRLLRRCLQKDPARRLGYMGDALLEIDDARDAGTDPDSTERAPTGRSPRWRWVGLAAAAGLLAGALVGGPIARRITGPETPEVTRFAIPLPPTDELVSGSLPALAISPDGRMLAYRARRSGTIQLFRRAIHEFEPVPIPGTHGAGGPFFSPDGEWIGFDQDGVMMKTPVRGGPPVRIVEAPGGAAGAWATDDTIVFSSAFGRFLHRVPASGGTPVPVTTGPSHPGSAVHTNPDVLPDGRTVLFTVSRGTEQHVAAARLDRVPATPSILTDGYQPRYLSTGHIVFMRQGVLWAARFDAGRLALAGQPSPVLDGVHTGGATGAAQYAVGPSGALVYAAQRAESAQRRIAWVDRAGVETPLPIDPRPFSRLSLSPDGTRLAVSIADNDSPDIWVYHLQRGTLTRVTADAINDTAPVWTPDGRTLVFRSDREGGGIFARAADGTGPVSRVTSASGVAHTPYAFTPGGRTLLFTEFESYRHQRIGAVPLESDALVRWLVDGPFAQLRPQVSPDGRWLAYQSDESGRFEVYVQPFPRVGSSRWQVSSRGGTSPTWSRDGQELFFHDGEAFARVRIARGTTFSAGPAERLFARRAYAERLGPVYDVAPDGQRFLLILDTVPEGATWERWHLLHVGNWHLELEARLARRGAS